MKYLTIFIFLVAPIHILVAQIPIDKYRTEINALKTPEDIDQ